MQVFNAINVPLRTAVAAFYKFWYIVIPFSFVSRYFLISLLISSLTHWLFRSLLFHFHICVNFLAFLLYFLLVSYHCIHKWSNAKACFQVPILPDFFLYCFKCHKCDQFLSLASTFLTFTNCLFTVPLISQVPVRLVISKDMANIWTQAQQYHPWAPWKASGILTAINNSSMQRL